MSFGRGDCVVDERRVERLLRRLRGDIAVLRRHGSGDRAELLPDPIGLAAIKYVFLTAIEGCIHVAQHVIASEGWEVPATNADAFHVLARHQVVAYELGQRLGSAAGFRNVLVHQYADVDDLRVIAHLDGVDDLDAFIDVVLAWMDQQRSG